MVPYRGLHIVTREASESLSEVSAFDSGPLYKRTALILPLRPLPMDSSLREGEEPQKQEPAVVQIDPKWCAQPLDYLDNHTIADTRPSLHSALKEFFEPLRTNDPRTDFFAIYRKESGEFDRDYAKKYDEDLNTSLIFVSRPISILDI
jgi:hypothetical protein